MIDWGFDESDYEDVEDDANVNGDSDDDDNHDDDDDVYIFFFNKSMQGGVKVDFNNCLLDDFSCELCI
jgi:hypothetical protein